MLTAFGADPIVSALAGLLIIASMLVLFARETYPPEVVAIGGAAAMFVLGLLPYESARAVFSNAAPWTIAAMFLVMGGLVRTGALQWLTLQMDRYVDVAPGKTIFVSLGIVAFASAFLNNTPVVVLMIPIFVQAAKKMGVAPSRVLIPLSYAAILGGTATLLGTSTNLLVDGVARTQGLEPFSLFEIAPLGIVQITAGGLYLFFIGRQLLPRRESMSGMLSDRRRMKYFTEVALPEDSSLIGQPVLEVELFKKDRVRVIDVLRGDASLRRDMGSVVLEAGDRVVLRTEVGELLGLQANKNLRPVERLSSVQTTTVEVLISPGCKMIGRSLGAMRLRRRYGVYPLAVHRRNENIGRQLDDVVIRVGDTLLVEGSPDDIQRLAADMDLVDITKPVDQPYRRSKAWIAVAALASVVVLAAFGVADILALALLAVAIVLIARCIDADEAFSMIEGRLLALIFAMLMVGAGLQEAGSVALIVSGLQPLLENAPPSLVIFVVYILASTLTELVTNNAVAVILTPIAIELGIAVGIDPRTLVVAVMFAASSAFCTPIGYQTNTLVYGPGGYRFTDFTKVGLPLTLLLACTATLVIPLIWPP